MPVLGAGGWQAEDMAPSFAISINDHEIDENVCKLIQEVEYDSADNIADMLKLRISNKDFAVSDKKVFQVGNVIKLWMGFNTLEYIGAAIIEKVRPDFPQEAMPTIEVIAYSADRLMMRNSPAASDEAKPFLSAKEQAEKREAEHKAKIRGQIIKNNFRRWPEGLLYSDVIEQKALAYGFDVDIDATPQDIVGPMGIIQKVGMTDYQFLAGIANELKWLFWVDMPEDGKKWVLHFRDPDFFEEAQDRKYTFRYNSDFRGQASSHQYSLAGPSTLLSFEGEQLMGEGATDLQIQIKNPQTGQLENYTISADPPQDTEAVEFVDDVSEAVEKGLELDLSVVTLSFGNVAVKVIADRQFQTPQQAKQWAERWYNEHHRDFFSGRGVVRGPGVESIRAMQVHGAEGLGELWSGDYYYVNVVHKMNERDGYTVTWDGRKVTSSA